MGLNSINHVSYTLNKSYYYSLFFMIIINMHTNTMLLI